jgi:hypothetical protein
LVTMIPQPTPQYEQVVLISEFCISDFLYYLGNLVYIL